MIPKTINKAGYGIHQSTNMRTDDWLSPPHIVKSLGPFDLDPCSTVNRPWDTALHHFTIHDNGFIKEWFGRVWLNPPYGKMMYVWVNKLALHGNGIALIFARTDTKGFQQNIFPYVDSIFFIAGRLRFHYPDGTLLKTKWSTAPSILCAFGENNVAALSDCGLRGKHVLVNATPVIIIGISPTWKSVVSIAISRLNGSAALQAIYDAVEIIAPDKIAKNNYYREKVRQTVQKHFVRLSKGVYSKQCETIS